MNFILFAWGASLLYGSYNVIGKLTSKYGVKNIWLFSFLYTFFATLITLPIAILNNVTVPTAWGNLLLSAIINVLFTIFYALAISKLDVTVLGPLFNFRLAFSVLLSITILGEIVPALHYLLIAIILIAGLFVSLDEKFSFKSFFTKSILYGVLMSFFLALHGVFINKAVAEAGYWETNFFGPLVSMMILAFTFPLFKKDIQKILSNLIIKPNTEILGVRVDYDPNLPAITLRYDDLERVNILVFDELIEPKKKNKRKKKK